MNRPQLFAEDAPSATNSPSDEDSLQDRRRAPRIRAVQPCELIHGPWRERQDGAIRNLHGGGARIRVKCRPEDIQAPVQLKVGEAHFPAAIAWRSRTEIGLRFLSGEDGLTSEQINGLQAVLRQMRGDFTSRKGRLDGA